MQAVEILVNAFEFANSVPDDMDGAVDHYLEWVDQADAKAIGESLTRLLPLLDLADTLRAAHIANLIGYLVEQGAPAESIASQVTQKLKTLAEAALPVWEAFEPKLAELDGDDEADPYELFDQHFTECEKTLKKASKAWIGLDKFYLLGVSLYSQSAAARLEAKTALSCLEQYAEFSEGAHWLAKIVKVAESQPLVVIDLDSGKGAQLHHSGVADNFQLQTLLLAIPGFRIDVDAGCLAVAQGRALPDDASMTSDRDMLNGSYAPADGEKADVEMEHRIWGEGMPVDIPTIERDGVTWQVVLLQQADYTRSWNNSRSFMHMGASVDIEKTLSAEDVADWLAFCQSAE